LNLINNQKSNKKLLLILFFTALIVRIYCSINTYVISIDGAIQYIPLAQLFACGKIKQALIHPQSPIYPFFLSVIHFIGIDWELSGKIVSIIFGIATFFPIFFFFKRIFGKEVAFLSIAIFALHPYLVRASADVLKETTYLFFFISGLWFSWETIWEEKKKFFPLAVIAIILATFTRPDGLEIFISILILPFLSLTLKDKTFIKKAIKGAIAFLLIFSFLIIPSIFLIIKTKKTIIYRSPKKIVHILKIFKHPDELKEKDKESSLFAPGRIYSTIYLMSKKIVKIFHPLLLFLFVAGFIIRKKFLFPIAEILIGSIFIIHIVILFFLTLLFSKWVGTNLIEAQLSGRHILPLVIISLGWISLGSLDFAKWLTKYIKKWINIKEKDLITICLILLLIIIGAKALIPIRKDKIGRKIAGEWILNHIPKEEELITSYPRIAFYAKRNFNLLTVKNPEIFRQRLKNKDSFCWAYLEKEKDPLFKIIKPIAIKKGLIPLFSYKEIDENIVWVWGNPSFKP